MAGTKLKVAGAAAAVVIAALAALTIAQQGFGPAVTDARAPAASGSGAAATQIDNRSRKAGDKPLWRALTPAQQAALQPLQTEWDGMDGVRKQKWLQLAARFKGMTPDERERVHERMRAWTKLTPEQRELARETYSRTRKIAPEQKNATWESYQQLPEEQKRKLATAAVRKPPSAAAAVDAKPAAALNKNVAACPAGTTHNTVSAAPPCVAVPAPPPAPAAPAAPPAPPAPPPQQEKPVPSNWGITPNNA